MNETILIFKRFMPAQPQDSPFILPSDLTAQAETAGEAAKENKTKERNERKQHHEY